MLSYNRIRKDLKDIRYYYSRKEMLDKDFNTTGQNEIICVVNKYNEAIQKAPIKLYDLYSSLYLHNNTQEVLADDLSFTPEYIQKLNKQLLKFFQNAFNEKKEEVEENEIA